MNQGRYVFAQLMDPVPRYEFNKCVRRYKGNYRTRKFSCWQHFLCFSFSQLTFRENLAILSCAYGPGAADSTTSAFARWSPVRPWPTPTGAFTPISHKCSWPVHGNSTGIRLGKILISTIPSMPLTPLWYTSA